LAGLPIILPECCRFLILELSVTCVIYVHSWGPKSYESLRSWVPNGDPQLQQAWMNDYLPAVEWMRQSGVPTSQKFSPIMTIGIFLRNLGIS
jgi:hypothetical protein